MKRHILALTLAALIPLQGCAGTWKHAEWSPAKPERAVWWAGAAADIHSSQQAFNRGAIEANPLIPCGEQPPAGCMLAAKALVGYPIMVLAEGWLASMQPSGRLPAWTKWLIWGLGGALQGLIAWHNSRVGL